MLRPAEPAKELKDFVRKYVQLKTKAGGLVWPIPARSIACMEFTFGDPYSIRHVDRKRLEVTHPATLIGAKTHQRIQLEPQGTTETFTILFQPAALQAMFSLPGKIIVNDHYDAEAVLGSRFSELREMLGETGSFEERVQIADEFFRALRLRVGSSSASLISSPVRNRDTPIESKRLAALLHLSNINPTGMAAAAMPTHRLIPIHEQARSRTTKTSIASVGNARYCHAAFLNSLAIRDSDMSAIPRRNASRNASAILVSSVGISADSPVRTVNR